MVGFWGTGERSSDIYCHRRLLTRPGAIKNCSVLCCSAITSTALASTDQRRRKAAFNLPQIRAYLSVVAKSCQHPSDISADSFARIPAPGAELKELPTGVLTGILQNVASILQELSWLSPAIVTCIVLLGNLHKTG